MIKKLLLTFTLLLLPFSVYAIEPPTTPPVIVEEEDGDPTGVATKIKFDNGALTKSGTTFTYNAPSGGDSISLFGTAVDTTGNFTNSTQIKWNITDGGAGGPDKIEAFLVGTLSDDDLSDNSSFDVGGFPADPDADKYLMWDDDPGELVWSSPTGGGSMSSFFLEDDAGEEVEIDDAKEVKFIDSTGLTINWTDTSNGTDADPFDFSRSGVEVSEYCEAGLTDNWQYNSCTCGRRVIRKGGFETEEATFTYLSSGGQ